MKRFLAATALTLAVLGVGCTPSQIAWFTNDATPAQQQAVIKHLQRQNRPARTTSGGSCYAAIDRIWPAESKAWFKQIVRRESHGIATAKNPRSSASGCAQLLKMHAHRIPGGWGNRFNADANIRGALSLYREAGRSPWRL